MPKATRPAELRGLGLHSMGFDVLLPKEGPTPSDYLRFARADLRQRDDQRARVNAVSNAKRALHFQVALISDAIGFGRSSYGSSDNFPSRLAFCATCGVVWPGILRRFNRLRNATEHDYYLPSREEAENFADVVELFLTATKRLVDEFPSEFEFVDGGRKRVNARVVSDRSVAVRFEPGSGTVRLTTIDYSMKRADFLRRHAEIRDRVASERRERGITISTPVDYTVEQTCYREMQRVFGTRAETEIPASDEKRYPRWVAWLLVADEILSAEERAAAPY